MCLFSSSWNWARVSCESRCLRWSSAERAICASTTRDPVSEESRNNSSSVICWYRIAKSAGVAELCIKTGGLLTGLHAESSKAQGHSLADPQPKQDQPQKTQRAQRKTKGSPLITLIKH